MPGTSRIGRAAVAFAFVVAVQGLWSCAPSRRDWLNRRWESFQAVLPPSVKTAVAGGDYSLAAQQVDSLLGADPGFAARWKEMKKEAEIELFRPRDVIIYYATYFGQDIRGR
jgi:hypothetical protein